VTISHLQSLFEFTASQQLVPIPKSLWIRRAEYGGVGPTDGVWAVFATHEEVRQFGHSHDHVNRIRKRLCMPVRGVRHGRYDAYRYTFVFLNILLECLYFRFALI
jgi:hypothetical protein